MLLFAGKVVIFLFLILHIINFYWKKKPAGAQLIPIALNSVGL